VIAHPAGQPPAARNERQTQQEFGAEQNASDRQETLLMLMDRATSAVELLEIVELLGLEEELLQLAGLPGRDLDDLEELGEEELKQLPAAVVERHRRLLDVRRQLKALQAAGEHSAQSS
jgi:hypothetical protein